MKTRFRMTSVIFLGSALLTAAVATAAPKFKTGTDAEVTFDGLHRIDDSAVALAWAKPDIDLSGYTKVMVMPATMTFKATRAGSSTEFALTDTQKRRLRDTLVEVFSAELGKLKRFQVTDQPGPDVLQIQGAILDVVSHVPPQRAGRGGYVLKSVGKATFVVELRDSTSGEILARAADRRDAASVFPFRSNAVSNLGEVRNAAHRWASLMCHRLEELATM